MALHEPLLADHPEATLRPIPELHVDEFDRFLPDFKKRSQPVVLRGYHNADQALHRWSFASLKERLPNPRVDLDVGDAMVTDGLTFAQLSLHNYLDAISTDQATVNGETLYLQGFDLFELLPEAFDEIDFPHLRDVAVRQVTRAWVGPAGTVTGYHADLGDNQLSQVVGQKFVKIVSPDQSDRVYVTKKYDPNGVACAVDADNWDRDAHPLLGKTNAMYVALEPGDSVFIPGGWFHYVRSLSPSISVNCVGYTAKQLTLGKAMDQVRRRLHNIGLYGDTCTCHMHVDGKRVARV